VYPVHIDATESECVIGEGEVEVSQHCLEVCDPGTEVQRFEMVGLTCTRVQN
jgi:hypothetical protein